MTPGKKKLLNINESNFTISKICLEKNKSKHILAKIRQMKITLIKSTI